MQLKHFKELDGIRAIAALMVMFFHFFQNLATGNTLLLTIKKYSAFGQTGVTLFFVLSGFLITRILLNTKKTNSFFINFYARRALRIFPLYFLFLIITYFIVPLLEHTTIVQFNQQIYYWVYLQNITITFNWPSSGYMHLWSLAVEEHFYLFWPFIIYFFNKMQIKVSIVLIMLLAILTQYFLIKNGYNTFFFTFSRIDELAIGGLLAFLEIEGKLKSKNSKKFLILFVLIIIPTITLWMNIAGQGLMVIQLSKFIILAFCYFSIIGLAITLKESNWLKKKLQSRFLTYTGKISYGLYIYHPLCFYIFWVYINSNSLILSFLLCFVFSYIVAGLSYHFFESKFMLFKNKFVYNKVS